MSSEISNLMTAHPDDSDLIQRAWVCGMRDGITTVAEGIAQAVADNDVPPEIQQILRAITDSIILASYLPAPGEGG